MKFAIVNDMQLKMPRRNLLYATGSVPFTAVAVACGAPKESDAPQVTKVTQCLRSWGFREINDGWTVQTYDIPTRGTVVYLEKLSTSLYQREVLPDGDVQYKGLFHYGIPELYFNNNPRFPSDGTLNYDTRRSTVVLRNPRNADPYVGLNLVGFDQALQNGWVLASVNIPTKGKVLGTKRGQGTLRMHNGMLVYGGPLTYRIESDPRFQYARTLAERDDPMYWIDTRSGSISFRRPDCR